MALFITSLNSGSNGNCYYVGNEREAVLIDAGISCREIEKRMAGLELPMSRIQAVFISHEHIDHIRGVDVLAKKYNLPVYITPAVLKNSPVRLSRKQVCSFQPNKPAMIGKLRVTAFTKH